jgi:hypothetical protein
MLLIHTQKGYNMSTLTIANTTDEKPKKDDTPVPEGGGSGPKDPPKMD